MKECQDQKVDMKKLEAIHKIKVDQWFKYSANINLEEELIENLNPNDVDINALFVLFNMTLETKIWLISYKN